MLKREFKSRWNNLEHFIWISLMYNTSITMESLDFVGGFSFRGLLSIPVSKEFQTTTKYRNCINKINSQWNSKISHKILEWFHSNSDFKYHFISILEYYQMQVNYILEAQAWWPNECNVLHAKTQFYCWQYLVQCASG